jgi:hypothetical protein
MAVERKRLVTLGSDDELVRVIEEEKLRRIRSGATKREIAQTRVVKAPAILDSIMCDTNTSSRFRIDAAKALDAIASPAAQSTAADLNRIVIKIDLTADGSSDARDVIHIDKPIAVGFDDNGTRFDKSTAIDADEAGRVDTATLAAKNRSGGDTNGGPRSI